jgi:hypothetical protein
MDHKLKCDPIYFAAVLDGSKTFDVRVADRPFAIDDTVILQEFDPVKKEYTGREISRWITYILDHPRFVKKGTVILGFADPAYPLPEDIENLRAASSRLDELLKDITNGVYIKAPAIKVGDKVYYYDGKELLPSMVFHRRIHQYIPGIGDPRMVADGVSYEARVIYGKRQNERISFRDVDVGEKVFGTVTIAKKVIGDEVEEAADIPVLDEKMSAGIKFVNIKVPEEKTDEKK